MQWLIIFILIVFGFGLASCSFIPDHLMKNNLPSIRAHVGKTQTHVKMQGNTNQIDHPIYFQTKDLTWEENFFYCVLIILALNKNRVGRGVKKLMKKNKTQQP